jgi:hypothetical protein
LAPVTNLVAALPQALILSLIPLLTDAVMSGFPLDYSGSESSRLLKNGLGQNPAFFRFLLPEVEIHFVEGPT